MLLLVSFEVFLETFQSFLFLDVGNIFIHFDAAFVPEHDNIQLTSLKNPLFKAKILFYVCQTVIFGGLHMKRNRNKNFFITDYYPLAKSSIIEIIFNKYT